MYNSLHSLTMTIRKRVGGKGMGWCFPSLLKKMPWVPRVPKCLSSVQMHKFPRGQVPKCLERPSSQVPFKCLSVLTAQVPKWLECPSDEVPLECPIALSILSASSVRVPWELKCLSKSVSQSASHSACLQCWFSKCTSTLRANSATGQTWFNFQQ